MKGGYPDSTSLSSSVKVVPSIFHVSTSLDLTLMRDSELKSLYTSLVCEMGRRHISLQNISSSKSKRSGEHYVSKWSEWQNSIVPRNIKWNWKKSSGKCWELTMAITGEDGNVTYYRRHGKTKRKTQQKLAEYAWYKYLNMGTSSSISSDEEN